MQEIYRTAWAFMAQHWLMLAMMAIVLEAMPYILSDSSTTTSGGFFVVFYVAFVMHRFTLFGETLNVWGRNRSTGKTPPLGWFFVASTVLLGFVIVASVTVVFRLFDLDTDRNRLAIALLTIMLPIYYLTLIVFGTALPAAAAGDRFGIRTTLRRTARTAGGIAGGLLVGPTLTATALVIPVWLGLTYATRDGGAFVAFGVGVLTRLGGFFVTALAVAVLCRAYRMVAPADPEPPYTPA